MSHPCEGGDPGSEMGEGHGMMADPVGEDVVVGSVRVHPLQGSAAPPSQYSVFTFVVTSRSNVQSVSTAVPSSLRTSCGTS